MKIEVPGIDEKDIDVRIENNTLTVHGERKIEKEEKEENYRRVERQYGSFTRTFTLPTTVDTENVSANYDKGVLKITSGQESRSQAEADQGQRGQRKDSWKQEPAEAKAPRQSRVTKLVERATPRRARAKRSLRAVLHGRRQNCPPPVIL